MHTSRSRMSGTRRRNRLRQAMVRVLWRIATEIKLVETLKAAFPRTWDTILSLSFYYISSGRNAAYLYSSWHEDHESPIKGKSLEGPDITRLFSSMEDARRKEFLKSWRNTASSGKAGAIQPLQASPASTT